MARLHLDGERSVPPSGAADRSAMIELSHVGKTFAGSARAAVGDLSFAVPEGEVAVLIGPSGCGKSTTLRMINRLIEPTAGTITVGGRDVHAVAAHELRLGIGYVIQQAGLFPHRTIAQNIGTVPRLLGWDRRRVGDRVDELMDLVGLDAELGDRYPAELSGGQQQRVGVARALAADPPVLLMDEPFGAVDPIVRSRLQAELLALQQRLHKTIVFVTHDIDEAIRLGDRMAVLNVGGVLEQYGPPTEVLAAPATDFVVEFLGAERGLKRLSLIPVSDAKLDPGPVVRSSDSPDAAQAVLDRERTDWVVVVDDGRLLGWVAEADLRSTGGPIGDAPMRPFAIRLRRDATLRDALDVLISSPNRVAVVVDRDDRYLGLLDVTRIGDEIETVEP
jgi:osmoprotectant transport system ATP-binding protein